MPALFEAVKCYCKSCNKLVWGWFKNDEYANYVCKDCQESAKSVENINNLTQEN